MAFLGRRINGLHQLLIMPTIGYLHPQIVRFVVAGDGNAIAAAAFADRAGAARGENADKQEIILRDLCETLTYGSLCALGGMTSFPVLSALDHFREDFIRPVLKTASA